MRTLIIAMAVAFMASIFMLAGSAVAGDNMSRVASQSSVKLALLKQYQTSEKDTLLEKLRLLNHNRVAFCGQCTRNADCGSGYKCAGRPECMECVKSP